MTIYDVLRRIIEARPFQDFERIEALKILDELEALNVFGTVANQIREDHEHQWADLVRYRSQGWPHQQRCTTCGVERTI